jgi:hypothetical protein
MFGAVKSVSSEIMFTERILMKFVTTLLERWEEAQTVGQITSVRSGREVR